MKDQKTISGAKLHDKEHDDHHLGSRRKFLRQLGLITAGTALVPNTPLQALGSSALAQALLDNPTDRILVLIRLKGGNDGLNTIVPLYDYGTYRAARPSLSLPQAQLSALNTDLAVSIDFAGAFSLWQQGAMRVVNGVGYPDANLSHFRGTDIITSASDASETLASGWLGRHLDACFPDYLTNPPSAPPAIQIGGAGSLTFLNDENVSLSVSVRNVEELAALAENGELYDTSDLPDCLYGAQLGYLRGVANSTFVYAGGIESAFNAGTNQAAYPGGPLSDQLALLARLIKGGLDTRLYMVTLEGFDTHAAQANNHPALLRQLGDSVRAFYQDLAAGGEDRRVISTTFSEFGRRIEENASGGTDHGTAAPQLLFGPALNGNGSQGGLPSLVNPDGSGNLNFTTDFREVYATLLQDWLCIPAATVDTILGARYSRLSLGFDCVSVGTSQADSTGIQDVRIARNSAGWQLIFQSKGGDYTLSLHDVLGREVYTITQHLALGEANLHIDSQRNSNGAYVYKLMGPAGNSHSGILPLIGSR